MGQTHQVSFPGLGINLELNTVAFSIGDFAVYWYGVIIGIGFILACIYALRMAKKMNINSDHLLDAVIFGLIAGVIGARLYYVVFYPGDKYWKNPMEILDIRDGGLGIYGGIIFALIVAVIVAKIRKMSFGSVLDIASLGFLIGQGIGRWANFINQEAFGGATSLPWGMNSASTEAIVPGANVHPCFFYESMLCLLGFVLLHLFTKYKRRYDGQTFLLYIIWYGVVRYIIEGTRTDSLMVPFIPIKVSQLVAVVTVIAAVIALYVFRKSTKLTGCGNKSIMDLNAISIESSENNDNEELEKVENEDEIKADSDEFVVPEKSTIFTRDYSKKSNYDSVNEKSEKDDD